MFRLKLGMASSWRIGSICGIPLLLNPTWFGSLGLFAFLFSAIDWQPESSGSWLTGLVMALLLFASVLLHELGHSLAAQSQGIRVTSIMLFPLGGIASIAQESETPMQAFWVAIAGPAVSFVLFVLLFVTSWLLPVSLPKSMLGYLAWINLVLALFNMLPGLPLDGGQVLKAAIWKITGNRMQGVRWAAQAGELLGWAAILVGLLGFFAFFLQFSFLWLVLLGWFGIRRARAYQRSTMLQAAMLQIQVIEAMQPEFQMVNADQTLSEFAALTESADDSNQVYYAESQGCYVGLVAINQLASIDRQDWETKTVRSILQPLSGETTVTESASLAEAILQLETQAFHQLPVVSATGTVIGVIDRVRIVQAIADDLHLAVPESVLQQIKTTGQFPPDLPLLNVAKDALR